MTGTVVPINATRHRLPQAGRIRTGVKSGRAMKSIPTFRFTSQKEEFIKVVADLYGGEAKPFTDDKSGDRFEVITQAAEINVMLPPDPLSEAYEMYTGKRGLERRCDGIECDHLVQTGDGYEFRTGACRCEYEGEFKCKYKLRLNVLLPEVQTLGTWRLDTSSENARLEIPGVVELIEMAQGRGLYRAKLRLELRTSPGKRYRVPVLDPGVSVDALSAGASRVAQLPGPPPPAEPAVLTAGAEDEEGAAPGGNPPPLGAPSDDDIIDAEVLDEHDDPTIGRAFLDNLDTRDKARALRLARQIAESMSLPVPTNAASIHPDVLQLVVEEFTRE